MTIILAPGACGSGVRSHGRTHHFRTKITKIGNLKGNPRELQGSLFWTTLPHFEPVFPENEAPKALFCWPVTHFCPSWISWNLNNFGKQLKLQLGVHKTGLLKLRFAQNDRLDLKTNLQRPKISKIIKKRCKLAIRHVSWWARGGKVMGAGCFFIPSTGWLRMVFPCRSRS